LNTKPTRVLMTTDAVGGVWQYTLDLARALRTESIETTIAVLGPEPSDKQRSAATEAGLSLVVTGLPLDWTADSLHSVRTAGESVARLAADLAADIVHLNTPALVADASFAAPVVALAHSCVGTWWHAVREGPLPEELAWRADLVGRGYRAADRVIAPTAAFADATATFYALPERPLVVHNGRRKFQLPDDSPAALRIFTAGRLWDEAKNIATLDRVAAHLAVPIVAAGPLVGPNGTCIHPRNLRTLGALDDAGIAGCLRARPVFVSLARYEPFGLAVLEAAQAGCALVLSDIPTFREVWDGAALFVPPLDDAAVTHALEDLMKSPAMRERLGRLSEQRSASCSVEAMSTGMANVYRGVLQRRSKGMRPEDAAA
jgi:glycosyltransferase involved in cell wall biosynthesis